MKYLIFIFVLSQPIMSSAKQATPDIKEGAWRIAIRMDITNVKGPSSGPIQFDRCMNPANVEGLLVMPPNAPCVMRKSILEKESLTWEMSCNQGGYSTIGHGRILFKNTRLEGEINTVAKGPQTINVKTIIEGRYLGKCVSPANPGGNQPGSSTPGKLQKFQED